ncbi:monocarboxylate transporter 3-like [Patiria miniata]|uniref:Major facilitator superfamily (MFS) profile domain-containing protein n=1 Tax=Patiria miniata TaxID=46514 RepID=A0A914B7S6_PATMI|nr:monocarboxylate transporter 3-like [Patiria miniata]
MASTRFTTDHYDNDRWGWVMVAVTFTSCFVMFVHLKALSVLLLPMTNDLESDLWFVGWIAVLYTMVLNCFGPVAGALSRLLGARAMMVFGGFLYTSGIILTSVSTTVPLLSVFTVGLSGVGSSLHWNISWAVMASYFKEKYPLAVGISTMGEPIGMMIFGPITQVLLDTYGWRGTMFLLGAISFHLVPCAMLVQRDPSSSLPETDQYQEVSVSDEEDNSQEQGGTDYAKDECDTTDEGNHSYQNSRQSKAGRCCQLFIEAIDFKVLADVRFILLTSGRFTATFAFNAWLVFMVPHGQFQGLSNIQASFLPTAFGVGNVVGKLVPPLLQKFGIQSPMAFWACSGAALVCVSLIAEAFIKPFIGQLAFTGLVGVGFAVLYQGIDVMIRSLSTDDRFISLLGWQGVFTGVAGALGGLVAGRLYVWTRSFSTSHCVFAGVTLLTIPLLVVQARYCNKGIKTQR